MRFDTELISQTYVGMSSEAHAYVEDSSREEVPTESGTQPNVCMAEAEMNSGQDHGSASQENTTDPNILRSLLKF